MIFQIPDKKEEEVKQEEEETDGKTEEEKADEEKAEDDTKIPANFYYAIEDMVSRAKVSEGSGLPVDLLSLKYPSLSIVENWCSSR